MDAAAVGLLAVVLFPLMMGALWCAIVFALATFGGWRRLAAPYRATSEPRGLEYRWLTGRVGSVPYRNVLTVHTGAPGLHLSVPLPFRIGHPGLLIPWSAVHDVTHSKVWGREVTSFNVGKPVIARIELPSRVMQEGAKP